MVNSFNKRAKDWDKLNRRVVNAKNIAEVIKENIDLSKDMHLCDIGAGTGLLSGFLADKVDKITAIDNSKGMIEEFLKKDFSCKTDAKLLDIQKEKLPQDEFDGIISSMTIHHIKDIKKLFEKLYASLKNVGFVAIADLDKEDGSFHVSNEGVEHFGFDFDELKDIAKKVGFREIIVKDAGVIKKPHKEFKVLVLIAKKIL